MKGSGQHQYTTDKVREGKNAAKLASRQAVKSTIVVNSPSCMAAGVIIGTTRRRQIEAICKCKAEADRQANHLKHQENEAKQECGVEAKHLSQSVGYEWFCIQNL